MLPKKAINIDVDDEEEEEGEPIPDHWMEAKKMMTKMIPEDLAKGPVWEELMKGPV